MQKTIKNVYFGKGVVSGMTWARHRIDLHGIGMGFIQTIRPRKMLRGEDAER